MVIVLGVVWQDCQSLPTRTLHLQLTSQWQKKPLPSLPQTHYSLHDSDEALTHFRSAFSVVVHPHTRTIVYSLFARTGIFPGFDSHSELGAVLFHPRFPVKRHSRFRLYDLLTYWYGRVIYCHFNVEIGAVVLPMSYGRRCSPQDLL